MSEFRVLTAKEQKLLSDTLEQANASIVKANAILFGGDTQPVPKVAKPRKARSPKVEAVAAQPEEVIISAKRRGRPPKAAIISDGEPESI